MKQKASNAFSQRGGKPRVESNQDIKNINVVRRKLYADGYVYEGAWMDAKWEGKGKLTSATGQVWEGVFKGGKICTGSGILVFPDGDLYEGKWVDGKMEGRGRRTQTDGSYLTGEFRNDSLYNGSGVLVNPDGTVLQLRWKLGKLEAELAKHDRLRGLNIVSPVEKAATTAASNSQRQVEERVNADGSVIREEFRNGEMYNGSGMLLYDGATLEGTRAEGKVQGQGKQMSKYTCYVGGLVNNLRHGHGILTQSDGLVYEGEWVQGKMHGQGKQTFPRGQVYAGEFRNNLPYDVKSYYAGPLEEGTWVSGHGEGQCELLNADGSVLKGEFKDGKIYNGSGVMKYTNGTVLEGTWVEGCLEGQGKIIISGRSMYVGELRHGMRQGWGTHTFHNGIVYVGKFHQDRQHGQGKLVNNDDFIYEGSWINGYRHGQGKQTCEKGEAEGEFQYNHIHNGKGVIMTCEGEWMEGTFYGTIADKDGATRSGTFTRQEMQHVKQLMGTACESK